ncbi:unnamed protein product [Brassica oleracea]|uniref:(rape) hypothetical protein n=1 Tax=Brassica napus TaxID=3708 RepID=A0A816KGT5_BRANA|nr:unnamed protein product [Brassica napus]
MEIFATDSIIAERIKVRTSGIDWNITLLGETPETRRDTTHIAGNPVKTQNSLEEAQRALIKADMETLILPPAGEYEVIARSIEADTGNKPMIGEMTLCLNQTVSPQIPNEQS